MPVSNAVGNAILNCYLRGSSITPPAASYISLHAGDPGLNGANEVSTSDWPSYVRLHASQGGAMTAGYPAASGKATTNALELLFPAHDGVADVTVTHVGFWDAPTGGNFILPGVMVDHLGDPTTKTYSPSDEPVIHAGQILVAVT